MQTVEMTELCTCGTFGMPCEYIAGGYCETGHVVACGPTRMGEDCPNHGKVWIFPEIR